MSKLIVSVSGIRGEIGINLTPEIAIKFAQALGTFIKGNKKVIIGRDTRITGDMMNNAVISGLLGTGCEVIDIGIAPTPTVQYLVKKLKADGGIVISASHNPIQWNALKLYKKGGILLNKKEGEQIKKIFETGAFKFATWKQYKKVTLQPELTNKHIEQTLKSIFHINKIKKKKYKVALDSCNASGSFITPKFLSQLAYI
jgi:phosphomannomutase